MYGLGDWIYVATNDGGECSFLALEDDSTAISGKVWNDLNYNGIQETGEFGLRNAQVELLGGNGNSLTPHLNTSTGPDGNYRFNATPGCQYKVKFTRPSGKFFSPKDRTGKDTKGTDADPKTGQTNAITTKTGGINSGWDAGLFSPFISGTAYWDKNKNG